MVFTPRRAAGSLSLDLQPVTKRSAALSLLEGSATGTPRRELRRGAPPPNLRMIDSQSAGAGDTEIRMSGSV